MYVQLKVYVFISRGIPSTHPIQQTKAQEWAVVADWASTHYVEDGNLEEEEKEEYFKGWVLQGCMCNLN